MIINGSDCSIVIKTSHRSIDLPYSDETIREAVSILQEQASIEGDGVCSALMKKSGVTGCVVTPLTIKTAPLLFYLAMGSLGKSVFISMTQNLYQYSLNLLPMEDTDSFELLQDRGNERRVYENCRINSFELRIMRDEIIKLKLDIYGDRQGKNYPYTNTFELQTGERFHGDFVTYKINGREYKNIYGLTLVCNKVGGTKTELWIKRNLEKGNEIPAAIEDLTLTAKLIRDKYESNYYGAFHITVKRLVLIADETEVNTSGAVIAPLRYYVAGTISTEIFNYGNEEIA